MSAQETVEDSTKRQRTETMGASDSAIEYVRGVIKEAKQRNNEIAALKGSLMDLKYDRESLIMKTEFKMSSANEKAMDELRRAKDSERETTLSVAQLAHDAAMKAKDEAHTKKMDAKDKAHTKELKVMQKKLDTMQSLSNMVKRVICVNDLDNSVEYLVEKVVCRMIVENGSFMDCPVDPVERIAYFERSMDEQAGSFWNMLKGIEKQKIEDQRQMEQMRLDSVALENQKKIKRDLEELRRSMV